MYDTWSLISVKPLDLDACSLNMVARARTDSNHLDHRPLGMFEDMIYRFVQICKVIGWPRMSFSNALCPK
jgi:hypothetical protein